MSRIDESLLDEAVQTARRSGSPLWPALLDQTGASESALAESLLEHQGVEVITQAAWERVKFLGLRAKGAAGLVNLEGRALMVSDDPWSTAAIAALNTASDMQPILALALPGQMDALSRMAGVEVVSELSSKRPESSPIVAFVESAIVRAYDEGASDIHFEADRGGVQVKYRLDGVMSAGERLEGSTCAEQAISRIKVLAQLDITERRRPQDGRFRWTHPTGRALDLRVSIMPSIFGEDAVLRLLDKAQLRHGSEGMSLGALGFDESPMRAIRDLASRPHGMLLVTGPTGSGKTTTLYAALSEVNDGLEKIVTIEDPVEYELPGVLQIPVNEQKGLTFATGLRSILRHDPDKILVGEIRDTETAEIAVQSSLTGHTVFTTVHANSLFDVLGRFQHFRIDPFALASALNGVVVQRLLRRVCPHCARAVTVSGAMRAKMESLGIQPIGKAVFPVGCEQCRGSGYRGRFVVAEVHVMNDAIRDLIVSRRSMTELKSAVEAAGFGNLLSHSLDKVAQQMTTLEEVARVVGLA